MISRKVPLVPRPQKGPRPIVEPAYNDRLEDSDRFTPKMVKLLRDPMTDPWEWYIYLQFTSVYHKDQANVGSYMDPIVFYHA